MVSRPVVAEVLAWECLETNGGQVTMNNVKTVIVITNKNRQLLRKILCNFNMKNTQGPTLVTS